MGSFFSRCPVAHIPSRLAFPRGSNIFNIRFAFVAHHPEASCLILLKKIWPGSVLSVDSRLNSGSCPVESTE